uniref:hypothetical protein n=1 Tax=Endozoicomonas sp. ONNA2 TaxID=2828741 RepID=UPI0021497622
IKDMSINDLGKYSFNWFDKDNPKYRAVREDTPCRLNVLQQEKTYHKCAFFFEPDIEEVLNQLPENLLGRKVYFSTAPYGDGTRNDLENEAYYYGYYNGMTTFYEESESGRPGPEPACEEPESVNSQQRDQHEELALESSSCVAL